LDEGSTAIRGWVVTLGQIDFFGTHWRAADGGRSLDLHGSPGSEGVRQNLKTVKGRRYRVTFWLAGNPGGTLTVKELAVPAAGQEGHFRFDTAGKSAVDMGWEERAWEFTADASETTLEFYSPLSGDPFYGPALDQVSVVAVGKGR
jgi:choice-of-anchor C domain-containing protein